MPRMEIELTSARDDGTWTWRAAGARQPRGVVASALLPEGVKVGDVVRAEADVDIDGITVTAVLAPRAKRPEPPRLEVLGPPPAVAPEAAPRRAGDKGGGPGRTGGPGRPAPGRERAPAAGGERTRAGRAPSRRPADGDRRRAGPGEAERHAERARPRGTSPGRAASEDHPPRRRPKRLQPGRTHREAALADLSPEQRPVAEELLRGGIPALRQALTEQNAKAKAAGQPTIQAEPLLAMAEELLPRLRGAEWRDRAEAAAAEVDSISLRDLRAVVAGAEAAGRDEAGRELASRLRQALDRRMAAERQAWIDQISKSLEEGRVLRALRISSRPPDPGTRFPAELTERLAERAGAALAPEANGERWLAVLEAVAASPVRRQARPAGLPSGHDEQVMAAARQAVGRVPALGGLLGLERPAPPRRPGPRPAGRPAPLPGRRVPPPPEPADADKPASVEPEPAAEPEAATDPEPAPQGA